MEEHRVSIKKKAHRAPQLNRKGSETYRMNRGIKRLQRELKKKKAALDKKRETVEEHHSIAYEATVPLQAFESPLSLCTEQQQAIPEKRTPLPEVSFPDQRTSPPQSLTISSFESGEAFDPVLDGIEVDIISPLEDTPTPTLTVLARLYPVTLVVSEGVTLTLNPPRWISRVIPTTDGEIRLSQSKEIVVKPHTQVIDRRNGVHGVYMQLFNNSELAVLEAAADCLQLALPPCENQRDHNNHYGRFRTMKRENFLLKNSDTQPVLDFIDTISIPILKKIEAVMTYIVPDMVKAMKEQAFCGIFPAFTITAMDSESDKGELHLDKGDARWALCAVVYFGNFTDGGLNFPDINLTILPERGGLALFNSGGLKHEVLKCTGVRRCLVLFVPATLFFPPAEPTKKKPKKKKPKKKKPTKKKRGK